MLLQIQLDEHWRKSIGVYEVTLVNGGLVPFPQAALVFEEPKEKYIF